MAFAQAAALAPRASHARRRAVALAQLWADAAQPFLTPSIEVDDALSRRELEVSFRAADGLSSREIAAQLFLSPRTVDNHLRSVYQKTGVRGRAELRAVLLD
ncbi:MAG: LuxR C-terminal-related transcriptional regulator [Candidatus Hydrogenedentota bacterium]